MENTSKFCHLGGLWNPGGFGTAGRGSGTSGECPRTPGGSLEDFQESPFLDFSEVNLHRLQRNVAGLKFGDVVEIVDGKCVAFFFAVL